MKRILFLVIALTLLISISIPTSAMAWTKWDLEGWRPDAGKWMDGLLFTWYECSWVPYRLEANGYDGLDTEIYIQHDYLDANGHFGIDGLRNFFIGPTTDRFADPLADPAQIPIWSNAGDGIFVAYQTPDVEVSNGWMIQYCFEIVNQPALDAMLASYGADSFAFYWEAHCSLTGSPGIEFGSSYWNGASLHAHTSVTGNQDVPIKTPPRGIEIEKEFSLDGKKWIDADIRPSEGDYNWIAQGTPLYIRIVVTNTSKKAELTNIVLTDQSNYPFPDIDEGMYPSSLAAGDSFTIIFGPLEYRDFICHHWNLATVTGVIDGQPFTAADYAWFKITH